MNALNKGKALTGFLTFLDIRGSSTRVTAIGNQPSVVPLLTDLLPAQRGGNSSDPAWSHGINEGRDEKNKNKGPFRVSCLSPLCKLASEAEG